MKRNKKNLPDMLAMLTDEAGHTTSITFEKTKDSRGYIFVRIQSIGYDESEVQLTDALVQYKWRVDRGNQYQQLTSHLKVGMTRLESRYKPKKNETWIIERLEEFTDIDQEEDEDNDDDWQSVKQKLYGMVVPYIQTVQGTIEIKY